MTACFARHAAGWRSAQRTFAHPRRLVRSGSRASPARQSSRPTARRLRLRFAVPASIRHTAGAAACRLRANAHRLRPAAKPCRMRRCSREPAACHRCYRVGQHKCCSCLLEACAEPPFAVVYKAVSPTPNVRQCNRSWNPVRRPIR